MASTPQPRRNTLRIVLLLAGLGASEAMSPRRAVAAQDEPGTAAPAASFVIPAYAFDRGNAKTWTDTYADAEPMIAWGGE